MTPPQAQTTEPITKWKSPMPLRAAATSPPPPRGDEECEGDPVAAPTTTPAPSFASKVKQRSPNEWIALFLPCYRWIWTYKWREYLQNDVVAGLTVGVMLVSQLAVGPVALVSLLVSNILRSITDSSDTLYTELATLLALMVGVLECIMGLLRLGWLLCFISHSVISGLTTASAIVIALSQAKYFLGYDIAKTSKIVPLIKSIISGIDEFSWPPLVMGSCILAVLLSIKHLGKSRKYLRFLRAAGPLTGIVLGTAVVKIFNLSSMSVESVGVAKALAAKNGYELDSSQEVYIDMKLEEPLLPKKSS
ncbi:hypothetical protein AKJ16_DCAP22974 [Drosera capensis]